jgi:hypothetical protein
MTRGRPVGPAPDHQRLAEQVGVQRAVTELAGKRDRMPAGALSGQVREQSR